MKCIIHRLINGFLILLGLFAITFCTRSDVERPALDPTGLIIIGQGLDDWAAWPPWPSDPSGDGAPGGIDFETFQAESQNGWLMLHFSVGQELVLQRRNSLTLLIDGDNDSTTGFKPGDIGAEFRWLFGERRGYFYEASGNPHPVTPVEVAIRAAPTFSSTEFEVAIGLDSLPGAPMAVFTSTLVRVVLLDDRVGGDRLPDTQAMGIPVHIPAEGFKVPVLSLERLDPNHFRILQHNVLEDGITKRSEYFRRMYRAANPDLLLLGEVFTSKAEEVQKLLQEWLPGKDNGQSWTVIRHQDGSMVASRFPIRQVEQDVESNGDGFLVRLGEAADQEIFVMHAWAACCDEDSARERHCDQIMALYRDAIDSGHIKKGTPVVLAGDFNLVTWRRHYEILRDGAIADTATFGSPFAPDWDGTSFGDLNPRLLALPMDYTWRNPTHGFSPGRLDYMLYTDSKLGVGNSFVLDDDGLPAAMLTKLGLQSGDCARAADHRPTVGDFFLKPPGNTQ